MLEAKANVQTKFFLQLFFNLEGMLSEVINFNHALVVDQLLLV